MKPKAYSYIRFSRPEQKQGDSLRRQVQQAEQYAHTHGLELDNTLKMTDEGLSGYHGMNRTKGALGMFLSLVEQGKIEPGSILIVENLDRLSREQVLDALNQFTGIIKAGIKIVTLQDGKTYDEESIRKNWTDLIVSISYMASAYEESKKKSERLKNSWESKRANIQENPLTHRIPYWLQLKNGEFSIIPEVAQSITRIFELKAEGRGSEAIAREMNEDPNYWKPSKNKRNKTGGWRKSYVNKILRNRQVLGEFQLYTISYTNEGNRVREPAGEPIKGYYPAIISEELFYRVQSVFQENKAQSGNGGGKTGKAKNLFTHVAYCGFCGSPMHFVDKGTPPKGGKYLQCDSARRKNSETPCTAKPVGYDEFERLFFKEFDEFDINTILPDEDEKSKEINAKSVKIRANKEKIAELDQGIENLSDTIMKTKNATTRAHLDDKLSNAMIEKTKLQKENDGLQAEMEKLTEEADRIQQSADNSKEIYQMLEKAENERERINLRFRLRNEIRKFVDHIKIRPLQEEYQPQKYVEDGTVKTMDSKYLESFKIRFKTGTKTVLRTVLLTGYYDPDEV